MEKDGTSVGAKVTVTIAPTLKCHENQVSTGLSGDRRRAEDETDSAWRRGVILCGSATINAAWVSSSDENTGLLINQTGKAVLTAQGFGGFMLGTL